MKKQVVIIGAGPAGITAGFELLKQSDEYEVTIFEESGEIGGISRTVKYHGNRMDIGGHRFFSKDQQVMDWWFSLLPLQGCPAYDDMKLKRQDVTYAVSEIDPEKTDEVMLIRNRVSRIYYNKRFFDYPVKLNWNTIKNMGFLTTVQAGFSYLITLFRKLPETSLENFYINRFGRKLYSMFFEGYTEKLWGRHPSEISADWGAQRVKGLSIIAILKDIMVKVFRKSNEANVETSLIEQFYYPKLGPGQLWEYAAAEFEKKGGYIEKNSLVTRVLGERGAIKSVEVISGGRKKIVDADIVISSMPLKDLVMGMNDVPDRIKRIAEGLPYRDYVTVGLLLKKMNLKNETKIKTLNNIIPDCWLYVQDTAVKLGRIQIYNNWSPYMVADPDELVWIGLEYFCTENDAYWNQSEEEWASLGAEELMKMGVISSCEDILDAHCEWVKKAYPAYFDTYESMDELIAYVNTFENLYCVGRNGQHRYNNMDHSMVTSFEAVNNILNGVRTKDNIWNVNTEKEYHEEVKS